MNRLYGLLTSSLASVSGYYAKVHGPVQHSSVSERLAQDFLKDVPSARLPAFACAVCAMAVRTRFGAEIMELDPANTYALSGRDPSASAESASDCVWDLMKPVSEMKALYRHLDDDLKEALCAPTYPEIAGAVCVQLLRTAF